MKKGYIKLIYFFTTTLLNDFQLIIIVLIESVDGIFACLSLDHLQPTRRQIAYEEDISFKVVKACLS